MGRFRDALAAPGLRAIAEIKRRSPSAGDLRPDADPAALAAAFERAGAAACSILVDERFGGSFDDLRAARAATRLSLLAKGFFTTEADLDEACAAGADAALLLLRDLDDATCQRLMAHAASRRLDTLVEAHDAEELGRAVALGADPIGINARDLATFRIDRRAQLDLVARARKMAPTTPPPDPHYRAPTTSTPTTPPPDPLDRPPPDPHYRAPTTPPPDPLDRRVVIAESGIWSRAQGAAAELAGADAILVGSALMRAPDPAAKLAELVSRPLVKVCGLTREEDVACVADAGADLAGFILAESPRRAAAPLPVPETMLSVAVFVGRAEDAPTDLVQLYAEEEGHRARDGVLLRDGAPVAQVIDLPWLEEDGGHWARAAQTGGRVVLAGGLGPENVRAAIAQVLPWCVDAARSLESAPGIKDHARVRAFVQTARTIRTSDLAEARRPDGKDGTT